MEDDLPLLLLDADTFARREPKLLDERCDSFKLAQQPSPRRSLRVSVYDEVSAVLDTQLDHPAVVAAVTFIEQWADRACVANSKEVVAANT
jgi:hypothetical protein